MHIDVANVHRNVYRGYLVGDLMNAPNFYWTGWSVAGGISFVLVLCGSS